MLDPWRASVWQCRSRLPGLSNMQSMSRLCRASTSVAVMAEQAVFADLVEMVAVQVDAVRQPLSVRSSGRPDVRHRRTHAPRSAAREA